jgi:hypothetical protein
MAQQIKQPTDKLINSLTNHLYDKRINQLTNWITQPSNYHSSGGWSLVSQRGSPGSHPEHSTWQLKRKERHRDRFLSKLIISPVNIIPPLLYIHSCMIWEMDTEPVCGSQFHRDSHSLNDWPVNQVNICCLLLRVGIIQSAPYTSASFWGTVRPHLSYRDT